MARPVALGAPLLLRVIAMAHRLLIVDDEPSIRTALTRYFTGIGFETDAAETLADGKRAVAAAKYDVVISDLRLRPSTEGGGLDLLAHVRAMSPSTHLVLLTAFASADTEHQAQTFGAVVVVKPKPLPDLAQLVLGLLGAA